MRYFVTGCAGFIGSNLVDRLLRDGHQVVGYDNLSTGQLEFLAGAQRSEHFRLVRGDTLDLQALKQSLRDVDIVVHLAANADVRFGTSHPRRDLEQNTIATLNVLEAMRENGVHRVAFSSTGSIYGDAEITPTPEQVAFPVQTSLYGASKLAAESLIQAYCAGAGFQGYIFRFVSILGERYTHGHVFDFYKQLLDHPDSLQVQGNGQQKKSYLYVGDCIQAVLLAIDKAQAPINVFNLGTDEYCSVNDSIRTICEHLHLSPKTTYTGGDRGWIGDSPFVFLDCSRIRALGWKPQLTIRAGILRTLEFIQQNPWILERRS